MDENKQTSSGEAQKQPVKRRRPKKRRRRLGILGALLYVVFVIGLSALLASFGWLWAVDLLALNKEAHSAVITITGEESFSEVADILEEEGIIEYKWLFKLFAAVTNNDDSVTLGAYELTTEMDYRAILSNLSSSSTSRLEITVTIPEGYTVMQIFETLEANGVNTVENLVAQAESYDYNFSFLQDIPLGDYTRLEGYLFPDTYRFYVGEDTKTVLNKMIVNFDSRFTDAMREQCVEMGYTVHDVVTIASMIEKETDGTDQNNIASVIYNRLEGTATNGLLNIDATIHYILPEYQSSLTYDDLAIDSPYNTYLYAGLPAGPISNPGMVSFLAALNPSDTNYYYYALGDDGLHHFSQTYDQHLAFLNSQERYQ